MNNKKKFRGGCHCGKVKYEVEVDLGNPVLSCNCSICSKKGSLLAFVPADKFYLLSGEKELNDYQFNKKIIHHLFCKTCGITSFYRGTGPDARPMCAINVRCLDEVDLDGLKIQKFDGKSL